MRMLITPLHRYRRSRANAGAGRRLGAVLRRRIVVIIHVSIDGRIYGLIDSVIRLIPVRKDLLIIPISQIAVAVVQISVVDRIAINVAIILVVRAVHIG
jgi:hypothetical protein